MLLGLEKMLCRGIGLVLILWCLKFRLDVFLGFILGLDPKPHTLNSELFRGRVSKWGCGLPHMHEKGRARCLCVCVLWHFVFFNVFSPNRMAPTSRESETLHLYISS